MKNITVTIDGVSGAGKGTTAKGVAKKLGYIHMDSGAMYRASSLFLNKLYIPSTDDKKITENLPKLLIDFTPESEILMNGENMRKFIRTKEVDDIVFKYAQNPIIRNFVKDRQKELLKRGASVIEGRDTGSVVFPEAELKIYIICDIDERTHRRALQYGVENNPEEVAKIKDNFETRDHQDKTREHSPMVIPEGAVIIDTTNLTMDEQIEQVYQLALDRIKEKND